jgi:hypothetical protein
MSGFDKVCAAAAAVLAALLMLLGAIGLFAGCGASFKLPPVIGVLPGLVGWGIIKSVVVAWRVPRRSGPGPTARKLADEIQGVIRDASKEAADQDEA